MLASKSNQERKALEGYYGSKFNMAPLFMGYKWMAPKNYQGLTPAHPMHWFAEESIESDSGLQIGILDNRTQTKCIRHETCRLNLRAESMLPKAIGLYYSLPLTIKQLEIEPLRKAIEKSALERVPQKTS